MTALILGPNGSGKSAYAEKLAAELSSSALYYIATMIPCGEDGQTRVDKHRKQRAAFGFITVERPSNASGIPIPPGATVLLEDVSNLLGNALFGGGQDGSEKSVFGDITALCARCQACVLVSIDGLTAQPDHNEETRSYIDALNRLNSRLSDFADIVIHMRDGIPIFSKGDGYALD